jgi:hypothetical protein
MTPTTPLATHNTTPRGEKNNDGGDSINDDESSVQSFSDEFRQHNKGIKQEVKLFLIEANEQQHRVETI